MKKNHFILLFALIAITNLVFSQNTELKWTEKFKNNQTISLSAAKNGNYYTRYFDDEKNLVFKILDKDLNFKEEKIIDFGLDSKRVTYKGAFYLNDKVVHFAQENNKKEGKSILYSMTTDLQLNTKSKAVIVDESTYDAVSFGSKSSSPDYSKFVIYNETKESGGEPNTLNFKVYDSSTNEVLFSKSVKLPINSNNFYTEKIELDNLGNVYVLAKVFKNQEEREADNSSFYYKVIAFNKNELTQKEFNFDYPFKEIASVDIFPTENNTLKCLGFIKPAPKKFQWGKGLSNFISDELFNTTIDCNTLEIKSSEKYKLEGLYPEKLSNSDYISYDIRNIFYDKDNSLVLVSEQFKEEEVYSPGRYVNTPGSNTMYHTGEKRMYDHYYCDIAVITINDKSQVQSIARIPKFQENCEDPSVVATNFDGITYLIYEDSQKNIGIVNDDEIVKCSKKHDKNALFLLSVDKTGKIKKEIIYSFKDSNIRPNILSSKAVNRKEILINASDQVGLLKL